MDLWVGKCDQRSDFPSLNNVCKTLLTNDNFDSFEVGQNKYFSSPLGLCHMKVIDSNISFQN